MTAVNRKIRDQKRIHSLIMALQSEYLANQLALIHGVFDLFYVILTDKIEMTK